MCGTKSISICGNLWNDYLMTLNDGTHQKLGLGFRVDLFCPVVLLNFPSISFQWWTHYLNDLFFNRNNKISETRGCSKCCIGMILLFWLLCMTILLLILVWRINNYFKLLFSLSSVNNPYNSQTYLCVALPKSVLLYQWYEPWHRFMKVQVQ